MSCPLKLLLKLLLKLTTRVVCLLHAYGTAYGTSPTSTHMVQTVADCPPFVLYFCACLGFCVLLVVGFLVVWWVFWCGGSTLVGLLRAGAGADARIQLQAALG